MSRSNPLSDFLREQAALHRAHARPDDPRHLRSAEALETLADHAERMAAEDQFQMRYLLEHHVIDGTFAWPEGQSGRTAARWGFDRPIQDPIERDQLLMDLCDLAKIDACRHLGATENGYDRADAAQLAKRFGLGVQLVHHAFDTGRGYRQLFAVAIPHWHELDDEARAELVALDGVKLVKGSTKEFPGETQPPLVACNIVGADEAEATELVARIAGIDAGALGVGRIERVI